MRISLSVRIGRPLQDVWDFVSQPENWVYWTGTKEVRRVDDGPLRPGFRFRTVSEYGGKRGTNDYEIKAFEPPGHMSVAGKWGSAPVLAGLRLEADGGSTMLHETVELGPEARAWRLLDIVAGWAVARYLRARVLRPELDRLRAKLEAD